MKFQALHPTAGAMRMPLPKPSAPLTANDLAEFGDQILQVVSQIQCEEIQRESEHRTSHRQPLVIPVTVRFLDGKPGVHCVSRNLSHGGLGLISDRKIQNQAMAVLELFRENGPGSEIVAECRWCKQFGPHYWLSGWQFIRMINSDTFDPMHPTF